MLRECAGRPLARTTTLDHERAVTAHVTLYLALALTVISVSTDPSAPTTSRWRARRMVLPRLGSSRRLLHIDGSWRVLGRLPLRSLVGAPVVPLSDRRIAAVDGGETMTLGSGRILHTGGLVTDDGWHTAAQPRRPVGPFQFDPEMMRWTKVARASSISRSGTLLTTSAGFPLLVSTREVLRWQ